MNRRKARAVPLVAFPPGRPGWAAHSTIQNMKYGLLLFFLVSFSTAFAQLLSVGKLTCEWKETPLGIERSKPLLSWQLFSGKRGVLQTAYRVLVADDSLLLKKNVGNLWDSKKVSSDASINVAYDGTALLPAKNYFWKVMVWDNQSSTATSKIASWQTGLFTEAHWKSAKWIAYEKLADSNVNVLPTDGKRDTYAGSNVLPLFRKLFAVKKPVRSATLFISGLGHFEASLNGKKIGENFLDPGWTKYDKQALYVPFDVTGQLKKGISVIGVMLGNGFYYVPPVTGRFRKLKTAFGFPKMICRLVIAYSDGTAEDIVSDESWRTSTSPITFSSIYGGEDYDARAEQKGWNATAFRETTWKNALVVDGPPELKAQMAEPLKVMEVFQPKNLRYIENDTLVYDLGQNMSGIPQITVQGKRGDTVRIYPAELVKVSGSVTQRASGGPYYLQYILKGDSEETWQPRFTYYGFRYLQVVGATAQAQDNPKRLPVINDIKGLHTRNAAKTIGQFSSSNDLFNKTYKLIDWSVKSNIASVFTDCPHREKLGWLEQTYLMGNSVHYMYDLPNLFRKTVADMRYSQLPDGLVPEIAPEYVKFDWGDGMFRDSPEWGSAAVIVPWYLYKWYGDKAVLRDSYGMMKRYMAYLQTKAKGNILSQGLGDWYDIGPKPPGISQQTPIGVTGTAIYYYDLTTLSTIASLLKQDEDAKGYQQLAMQVKQSFNDSFYHPETKQYATGSQTANAMAIYMKLVNPADKDAVLQNLVADIQKNNLTAGDIGYRFVLAVLHQAGRDDVIYNMNNRSDVPGYGYQLAKGATALTESWQALPTVSNNHFMLGHLMEWFYAGLGGIEQADNSIAYKEITIDPRPIGDMRTASVSYECPYGLIKTEWERSGMSFQLSVTVPANTTATVYLSAEATALREGNEKAEGRPGVKIIGEQNGKLAVKVGSGTYRFFATLTKSGQQKTTD